MAGLKRKATSQAEGNDTNKKSKSGKTSGNGVVVVVVSRVVEKLTKGNTGSHQQQKALKLERKAQDPKFDMMTKTKKIWETLRRGDISKEETKDLMSQIMALIAGHVKEVRYKKTAIQQVTHSLLYNRSFSSTMLLVSFKPVSRRAILSNEIRSYPN